MGFRGSLGQIQSSRLDANDGTATIIVAVPFLLAKRDPPDTAQRCARKTARARALIPRRRTMRGLRPFSVVRRDAAAAAIPWAVARGTDVIVYSPMQSGLLTDRWTVGRVQQ